MAMPPPPPMSQSILEDGLRPGGSPPDEKVPGFMVCMNVISTVTHLLLGAVVLFAFFIINVVSGGFEIDTAHVYLTMIGYSILMSQAIFSLNPQAGWANNFKYPQKTMIFWLLQVLGSLLAIMGGIMGIIVTGSIPNSPVWAPGLYHLQSAHQKFGLAALILTTVSFVGGLFHLFNNKMENTKIHQALQSCSVTLTLVIAFIAIGLAFTDWVDVTEIKSTNMALSLVYLTLLGMFMMMICKAVVKSSVVINLFKEKLEISKRLVDASRDPRAGFYLGQRLSGAIQRGNAASLLGTLTADSVEEQFFDALL